MRKPISVRWTKAKGGEQAWFTMYRNTRLRMVKSFSEYVVWCGPKSIVTGATRYETEANLKQYLADVEAGEIILGQ